MNTPIKTVSLENLTTAQKTQVLDEWLVHMLGPRVASNGNYILQVKDFERKIARSKLPQNQGHKTVFLFFGEKPVAFLKYLKTSKGIHISIINGKKSRQAVAALRAKGINHSPALELLRRVIISQRPKKVTYATITSEMSQAVKKTLGRKKYGGLFGKALSEMHAFAQRKRVK